MADLDPPRRMACLACTKAKRRCTKQTPACNRCTKRRLTCTYPPPKVTIPLEVDFLDTANIIVDLNLENHGQNILNTFENAPMRDPNRGTQQRPSSLDQVLFTTDAQDPWFLASKSWTVDQWAEHNYRPSFWDGALRRFIDQTRDWLKQWVNEGRCPFIHSHLYRQTTPPCIKSAFAATATYLMKQPPTEAFILRIVEDSNESLLKMYENPFGEASQAAASVSLLDQLARTHSLLVYSIIRLFDGDVRSRAQAELALDTLSRWASEMLTKAKEQIHPATQVFSETTTRMGSFTGDAIEVERGPSPGHLQHTRNPSSLWRMWYISESVRRTYLAATYVQGIYMTLKQGWTLCPGGVYFSARKGLWDATTPHAWSERFRSDHLGGVESKDLQRLFFRARPSDVDEFTIAILTASHGLERLNQWAADKADPLQ